MKLVARRRSGNLCSLPVDRLGTDGQMCSAKCVVCSAHCTMCIVQCVAHIVQCALCNTQFLVTVCSMQCLVLCVVGSF